MNAFFFKPLYLPRASPSLQLAKQWRVVESYIPDQSLRELAEQSSVPLPESKLVERPDDAEYERDPSC